MLDKAKGYGDRRGGFILDRGYFSKENIHFMDDNGYDFVMSNDGREKRVYSPEKCLATKTVSILN